MSATAFIRFPPRLGWKVSALEHQNEEHLKYWMKETKLLLLALASRFEIQRTYFENVLRISLIEVLLQNSTKLYFI